MNLATPQVGQRAEPRTYGPITPETIVRYSAASGDLNPMHYDKDFAQQAGYPTVFSQGMNSAALLGSFLCDWFEPAWIRRFGVRFRELVWPGDLLECSGEVVAVAAVEGGSAVSVELRLRRQSGETVLEGSADLFVPESAASTS
jgi:acyl dehydratase